MGVLIRMASDAAALLALIEAAVAVFVINHVFLLALLAAPLAGALLPTPDARSRR